MAVVKDGNFDVKLSYKRNDEFAFLIAAYNKMVERIKELINKLYVSELNKKEAELEVPPGADQSALFIQHAGFGELARTEARRAGHQHHGHVAVRFFPVQPEQGA